MEQFLPLIILFAVGYALVIRPQQKKQKEERELMASLRAGDEVMTVGGIYGVILEVPDGEPFVWLDVAEGTELKMSKSAVRSILSRDEALDLTAGPDADTEDEVDESLDS